MVSDVGAAIAEAKEMVESGPTRGTETSDSRGVQASSAVKFPPFLQRSEENPGGGGTANPCGVLLQDPGIVTDALVLSGTDTLEEGIDVEAPKGMCHVPSGIFQFGDSRQVRSLPDYYIDTHPVTNADYAAFVSDTGYRPPRFWDGCTPPADKEDHPVVGISFEDARAYADWAGKDLPSEEEWEKAARGCDGRAYPWGDLFSQKKSNVSGSGIKDTCSVKDFTEGKSQYGCMGMAGNIWEWTRTPFRQGGKNRALKGGSWYDFSTYARCASRFSAPLNYEGNSVGFRCVLRQKEALLKNRGKDRDKDGNNIGRPPRPGETTRKERRATVSFASRRKGESTRTPGRRDPGTEASNASKPLRAFVENTVFALDRFDVSEAKARVEEVLESNPDPEPAGRESLRPEVEPEFEVPLPEGKWTRHLSPGVKAIRLMLPGCYRVGDWVDAFFRKVPRWVSIPLIVTIPVLSLGLVLFGSDRAPKNRGSEAEVHPLAPRKKPAPPALHTADRPERKEEKPARSPDPQPIRPASPPPRAGAPEGGISPVPPTDMVYVPPGEFLFGRQEEKLSLPGFFMDEFEVTNLQYQKFLAETGYPAPGHWKDGKIPAGLERHPVTYVDHADARAFAKWARKRLPTEQEWEKAARGVEGWIYPWGDDADPARANLFQPRVQMLGTREVGTTGAGLSPYRCHDMAGNVLEWTTTREGENYVLKGGSWGLSRENGACHFRYVFFPPETRTSIVGFRCARDLSK